MVAKYSKSKGKYAQCSNGECGHVKELPNETEENNK